MNQPTEPRPEAGDTVPVASSELSAGSLSPDNVVEVVTSDGPSTVQAGAQAGPSRLTYILTAASALALPAAAVLTSPLLARALGAEGRGEMSAVLAPAVLTSLLATAGIPDALTYFIAKSARHARSITLGGIRVSLMVGVASFLILTALSPVLLRNVAGQRGLFISICALMPLTLAVGAMRGSAQGLQLFNVVNRERWTAVGFRVVALIVFYVTGHLDVFWAVWITWVCGLVAGLVYLPMILRLLSASREKSPLPVIKYGLHAWSGNVAGMLVFRLDQILLAVLVMPVEVGYYSIAVALAEVPQAVIGAIRQIVISRSAGGSGADVVARTNRVALVLSVLAMAAGAVLAPLFVPLIFGNDFAGAVPVTQILLVATLPASLTTVVGAGLLGAGRPLLATVGQVIGLVITVVALVALVPTFGALGAAYASLVAYAGTAVALCVAFTRVTQTAGRELLVPTRADVLDVLRLADVRGLRRLVRR